MALADEFDRSPTTQTDSPQPPPIVKHTPDGTIDENIYCLNCGYNLRGLSGDPVRCPECGSDNQLGDVILPAEYITDALKKLESAPTACVSAVLMIIPLITLSLAAEWPIRIVWLGLAVAAGVRWTAKYRSFAATLSDRISARSIIVQFHLIALLCVAAISILTLTVNSRAFGLPAVTKNFQYGPLFGSALLIGIGLLLYRRMQIKRRLVQRETAVRIAREMLRKELTGPR